MEVARVLLEHNSDKNCPTMNTGMSPLHISSEKGDLEMVKLLMEYNAALEVTCKTWTALHFAVKNSHLSIAQYLIEHGAEHSAIASCPVGWESKLMTPLDIAIESSSRNIIAGLLKYPKIETQRFATLSKLKLNQLNIQEFPEGVINLRCLTKLDLSYSQISTIPDSISNMNNLRTIDISHGAFNMFPISLCSMEFLQRVSINFNSITRLPKEILGMKRLERLDISNNSLFYLPEELGQLAKLKKLSIEGNPLNSFTKELLSRSTVRFLEYLRQISDKHSDWRKMKLMFVGEECVGKTSIFLFYII